MNFAARLTRLEKLAGKDSCPYCRLSLRHSWPNPSRREAKDRGPTVTRTCSLCGRRHVRSLSLFPADVHEVVRLCLTSDFEETFTNPRAWVAWKWMLRWIGATKERQKVRLEIDRSARPKMDSYERDREAGAKLEARLEREASPGYKLLQKLRKEMEAGLKRRSDLVAAKYGDDPFPELTARIKGVEFEGYGHLYRHEPFSSRVRFSEMYHTEIEAKHLLECAEAEKILLGDIAPSTADKLDQCERRAKGFIEDARRRHEAFEEQRRRKEEEQAQKQRELLERSRPSEAPAAQPPPEAPAAPARNLPDWATAALKEQEDDLTIAQSQAISRPTPPTNYDLDYWSQLRRPAAEADPSRFWVTGRRRRPR